MKKLADLKSVKKLSKMQQKSINGSGDLCPNGHLLYATSYCDMPGATQYPLRCNGQIVGWRDCDGDI